jgi:hypothetical protein
VLFSRMLSDSWARGDRSLDLGPGTMEYKARWCTRFAHSYRYTHYPRLVPRAQLLRLKHWMVGRRDLDELAADDIVGGDRDKSPVDAGYFGSTPVSINK